MINDNTDCWLVQEFELVNERMMTNNNSDCLLIKDDW